MCNVICTKEKFILLKMEVKKMVKNFRKLSNKLTCYGLIVILVCMFLAAGTVSAAEWSLEKAAKPYAGQTINVVWFAVPWSIEIAKVVPQFEKETGINVKITDYPYESLHEKVITELAAGTRSFDLVLVDMAWMPEVSPWLLNLEKFQADHPELVDPQFNWNGIHPRVMKYGPRVPGYVGAFPGYVTNHLLVYRKDLFDNEKYKEEFKKKYGYDLKVPNVEMSLNEFKDVCEFFTRDTNGDGKIDLYGYCSASARTALDLLQEYNWWLVAHGGKFFEDWEKGNFRPMFDTPEALAALRDYKDLLKYQPPGVAAFGVFEQTLTFQKGEAAMIFDWTETFPDIEDPEKSEVAGKVGYSSMPQAAGEFAPMPVILPDSAKHKEAAFLFGQWVHSRKIMTLTKISTSPRISMLIDPELQKKYPFNKASYDVFKYGYVSPQFPEFMNWAEIVQSNFSNYLIGEISAEKAVQRVQKESESLLKEAGYKW